MFTGIIQETGTLIRSVPKGQGRQLDFSCSEILSELHLGESVCCNGVCLSVTELLSNGFRVFAVSETLSRSNLGRLSSKEKINLELALRPDSRLGGHFVSGHIDGTARIGHIKQFVDGSREISLQVPEQLSRYCIEKGSVALNGVSLTIASITDSRMTVALIQITLEHTNLGSVTEGDSLNLEVDLMGKYVEKLLHPYVPESKGITEEMLAGLGYHA